MREPAGDHLQTDRAGVRRVLRQDRRGAAEEAATMNIFERELLLRWYIYEGVMQEDPILAPAYQERANQIRKILDRCK